MHVAASYRGFHASKLTKFRNYLSSDQAPNTDKFHRVRQNDLYEKSVITKTFYTIQYLVAAAGVPG